jgi:hypothetical protein
MKEDPPIETTFENEYWLDKENYHDWMDKAEK